MTQKQCVAAYKALERMTVKEWPFKVAYGLMKLKRALEPVYTFQCEQERRLMQKHGGKPTEDGRLQFDTAEACKAFLAEREELENMDADIDMKPVTLAGVDGVSMTPDDLAALDGFVTAEEG